MKQSNFKKAMSFFFIYMLIGALIISQYPENLTLRDSCNYLILTVTYFIVVGTLLLTYIQKGLDIFEPIILITFIYVMTFCITPILNIISDKTIFLGVDLMDGCVKATLCFLISYFAFYIGYYYQKQTLIDKGQIQYEVFKDDKKQFIYFVSLIIWIVCYVCILIYIMSSGKSFAYIISVGMAGNVGLDEMQDTPIKFLGIIGYSLIPAFMYIFAYSKNNFLKILLGILTLTSYLVIGFRFIVIVLIFAPIIYTYMKKNQRPTFSILSILFSISIIMIGIVGFIRKSVRSGESIEWTNFDLDTIIEAVSENYINIYMPFYGLVNAVPSLHDYTLGQQFLYTIVMIIPRAIWPGKPEPMARELIEISVNSYASIAGVSWPNIGEYYLEFGILGCVICMFIFGKLCGWCKKLYQTENPNDHTLIAYSMILPACLQLVIRGYTPSNFYLMVFLLLPIIFIKWIVKKAGDENL